LTFQIQQTAPGLSVLLLCLFCLSA
jgi:hypothetical protein